MNGYPAEQLEDSYHLARRQAAKQTGLDRSAFPQDCPYPVDLVLSEDWLPEG